MLRRAVLGSLLMLMTVLAACAGSKAEYPVADDPLAQYELPEDSGSQTDVRTTCDPDDHSPVASWSVEPTDGSQAELVSTLEDFALQHGWTRNPDLQSSSDLINLIKDPADVSGAGAPEDEQVSGSIFVTADGVVGVTVMAHGACS